MDFNEAETLEQKRRRLLGKKHLNSYLKELNTLTNLKVTDKMLLSISESDKIQSVSDEYSYKNTILFNEKNKLSIIIHQLISFKDSQCYLWTKYSKDCGVLKLNSLKDFNLNFSFEDEHSGLITITLIDTSNELILDYYEEEGIYYLEIETFGKDWSKARLPNG